MTRLEAAAQDLLSLRAIEESVEGYYVSSHAWDAAWAALRAALSTETAVGSEPRDGTRVAAPPAVSPWKEE